MGMYFNDDFEHRLASFKKSVEQIEQKYKETHLKNENGSYLNISELYVIKDNEDGDLGIGFRSGYLPDFIESEVIKAFMENFSL